MHNWLVGAGANLATFHHGGDWTGFTIAHLPDFWSWVWGSDTWEITPTASGGWNDYLETKPGGSDNYLLGYADRSNDRNNISALDGTFDAGINITTSAWAKYKKGWWIFSSYHYEPNNDDERWLEVYSGSTRGINDRGNIDYTHVLAESYQYGGLSSAHSLLALNDFNTKADEYALTWDNTDKVGAAPKDNNAYPFYSVEKNRTPSGYAAVLTPIGETADTWFFLTKSTYSDRNDALRAAQEHGMYLANPSSLYGVSSLLSSEVWTGIEYDDAASQWMCNGSGFTQTNFVGNTPDGTVTPYLTIDASGIHHAKPQSQTSSFPALISLPKSDEAQIKFQYDGMSYSDNGYSFVSIEIPGEPTPFNEALDGNPTEFCKLEITVEADEANSDCEFWLKYIESTLPSGEQTGVRWFQLNEPGFLSIDQGENQLTFSNLDVLTLWSNENDGNSVLFDSYNPATTDSLNGEPRNLFNDTITGLNARTRYEVHLVDTNAAGGRNTLVDAELTLKFRPIITINTVDTLAISDSLDIYLDAVQLTPAPGPGVNTKVVMTGPSEATYAFTITDENEIGDIYQNSQSNEVIGSGATGLRNQLLTNEETLTGQWSLLILDEVEGARQAFWAPFDSVAALVSAGTLPLTLLHPGVST